MSALEYTSRKYKAYLMSLPSLSVDNNITIGVTYFEDNSDWLDNKDGDLRKNFIIDCSRERAEEVLRELMETRFFWYERYPKFYKPEWKKYPASFDSRLRRRMFRFVVLLFR